LPLAACISIPRGVAPSAQFGEVQKL